MKNKHFLKTLILAAFLALMTVVNVFAAEPGSSFPFTLGIDMEGIDKLCYAGHIAGGGMFYDDGLMVTPDAGFSVDKKISTCSFDGLSAEIELIYEKQDNTGSVRETVRKYEPGDLKAGVSYPLFSETAQKNLKQRKKLYSSDVMSAKLILTYESSGGLQKKQVYLFYIAKPDEYDEKVISLMAPVM